jgi:hypothetical protein
MAAENSPSDIFRFVQLRPKLTVDDAAPIALDGSTPLVKNLSSTAGVTNRAKIANAALREKGRPASQFPIADKILADIDAALTDGEATTGDLASSVPAIADFQKSQGFKAARGDLSDLLVASLFATDNLPRDVGALQTIYRVYNLPDPQTSAMDLRRFLRLNLLSPVPVPTAERIGDQP